jgi:EAL domain-containing protein (putative c-di-GMP-specific phosphodiesterase class I)
VSDPFKVLTSGEQHWISPPLPAIDSDTDFHCDVSGIVLDSSLQLSEDLGEALRLRKLRVEYQPQFELSSGRGCGVEALARWTRSNGEIVTPSVFIPLAERRGMIHSLGAWILQSACMTASRGSDQGSQGSTLSVNVSALQIDELFFTVIERALAESRFPASRLELEITESTLIANPLIAIEHLKRWKHLGVRIALDDFGAGYSSLAYLCRMPIDRLKLDRSLIHRMTLDRKSEAVMRSIVSLGAELGMEVIAEGVETERQLKMLINMGCPQAQGYLLGRPMCAEQARIVLSKAWGNRPARHKAKAELAPSRWPTHAI